MIRKELDAEPGQIVVHPPRFTTGSRPKRAGRLAEIMEAVADALHDKAADVAEELRDVANELGNITWP